MSARTRNPAASGPSSHSSSGREIRYPLALPTARWKRAPVVGAGRALLALRPGRAETILREGDPMSFSAVDRLFVAGLVSQAKKSNDWTALSGIQQRFWAGEGGAIFNSAPEVAQRFRAWFLKAHSQPLGALQAELAENPQTCRVLCEIGSGNGLALEHLSYQLPSVPRFVGVDINVETTAENSERWRENPKLEFVADDAVDWIDRNAAANWAYFSNAGVLEYFPQAKVERLYRATAALGGPAWWVLTEPLGVDHDLDTETDSRVHGSEYSFSHNHPHLLRSAGWEIIEQSETHVAGFRWLMLAAKLPNT